MVATGAVIMKKEKSRVIPSLDLSLYRKIQKSVIKGERKKHSPTMIRRLRILQACNWSCVSCGRKRGLTIHHKTQKHNRAHKNKFFVRECVVLCSKCHRKKHGFIEEKKNEM